MHRLNWLFPFMLLALLLSCTSTPSADKSSRKEVMSKESGKMQMLQPQLRSLLERRECLKALRLMQQEVKLGLSESSLAEEYGLALRGGMNYSNELWDKKQFSACGVYSRQLLRLYPRTLPVISGVSKEQIRQRMNCCSDQLMAKGLAAYRAGEMQEAIDCWTALLVFHPERTEARKAIDTCSIQLRNLKAKP